MLNATENNINKPDNNRLIITIVGPSGTGKTTLMQEVIAREAELKFFITATSREPRDYEVEGQHYYFMSREDFIHKLNDGAFLEYSEHYNNYYGTLNHVIFDLLAQGNDVITDMNWTGVAQMEKKVPEHLVKILVLPPSADALRERFERRAKKSKEDAELIRARFEQVHKDISHIQEEGYVFTNPDMIGSTLADYDYTIMNDSLESAAERLLTIIKAERLRRNITND